MSHFFLFSIIVNKIYTHTHMGEGGNNNTDLLI